MIKSLKNRISPEHLFITGLIIIPPFIFQEIMFLKWMNVLLFMLLASLCGKRIRIMPVAVMTSGIITANLLSPSGEVIFTIFTFPVTSGAFFHGLDKAALLTGMIYISKFAVSSDLKLPGGKGNILSLVFYYFEKIMETEHIRRSDISEKIKENKNLKNDNHNIKQWKSIFKNISIDLLIKKIDSKILAVSEHSSDYIIKSTNSNEYLSAIPKTGTDGLLLICLIILISWISFFLPFLYL